MRLVIGGYAQGKLDYIMSDTRFSVADVTDGGSCALDAPPADAMIIDRLHILIRRLMLANVDPGAFIDTLVVKNPDATIICDELGCGVIPLDGFEREWRETVGRICCRLARESEAVERIFAGLPTVIKGK